MRAPACFFVLVLVACFPLQQVVELLVPALIILLIGTIKSSLTVEEIPEGLVTTDTPIVTYESMQNVSAYPNVLCYDNNMFLRYLRVHTVFITHRTP